MAYMTPIIAAAAKKRRDEEEERMGQQLQEELGTDWEFKIVRGSLSAFGNPRKLQQMLQEEARAGWDMAGKLDNDRVFLKRLKSARAMDHLLEPGVDPYRTNYGGLSGKALVFVLLGTLVLGVGVFAALARGRSAIPVASGTSSAPILMIMVAAAILAGLLAVVAARK